MERKIYGIFVAGGSGTRMGASVPKQFLRIGGRTILEITIGKFVEACPGIEVITVLPKDHIRTWKDICRDDDFNVRQTPVEGGITRFHSVRNALEKVPDGAVVAIQDGVRPLLSAGLVRSMLEAMDRERALVPVIPVVDTLRSKVPSVPHPDRSALVAVQTPQIFRSEDIRDAYTQAFDESFTDDASVAERKGIPLTLFPGERYNIKITTPEDYSLAEKLLL